MITYDLIKDTALVTSIKENTLRRLMKKAAYCICNDIEEGIRKGENIINFNLGIGIISVYIDESTIKYGFTPTPKFENIIRETINEGKNPLTIKLEEALVQCLLTPLQKDLT